MVAYGGAVSYLIILISRVVCSARSTQHPKQQGGSEAAAGMNGMRTDVEHLSNKMRVEQSERI